MAAAAKDADPEIQDTASRMLGAWMDVDAAPVLLDLAKNAADEKYKIRAPRGYIRLVAAIRDARRRAGGDVPHRPGDRTAQRREEAGPGSHGALSQRGDAVAGAGSDQDSGAEKRGRGRGAAHRRENRRPFGHNSRRFWPRWATGW